MGFLHRPQLVSWRKAVFQIHLWTGVALGLYVVAISVSGSALVFQSELMDHRPTVSTNGNNPQLNYTQLVAAAQTAFPGLLEHCHESGRRLLYPGRAPSCAAFLRAFSQPVA